MAITESDLKLLKSINMSNDPDGGGLATNQVITDNVSNAIFDDITSQDQKRGKVNERKAFFGVQSANAEKVLAAMAFITKIPKNENVTMNLYRSESFFDTRSNRVIKKKGTNETVNQHELRLDNNAFNDGYATAYGLSVGKYMSCFVTGTISAGATQIVVTGIDGILNTTVYAEANLGTNATAYGTSGLMKILQNGFVITDGTNSENIKVKTATITKYINSFSADETYNEANQTYTTNSPNIGGYSNNIESKKPYKKYVATLTLTNPLAYSYVAATESNSATWLSEETKLLTVGGAIEKFYTAKPLKNPITAQDNSIDIFENINHVLPIEENTTYDPEILGIDPTGFAADGNYTAFSNGDMVMILNEIETTGTYASGQTVNLSRPNLAKVMLRDKNGAQVLPSKYSANLLVGNVKMLDLTGVAQPITIIDRIEDLCLIKSNTGSTITETVNEEVIANLPTTQTVTTTTKNALVTLTHAATMIETGFSATILVERPNMVYAKAIQDITGALTDVVPTYFTNANDVKIETFTAKALVESVISTPTPRQKNISSITSLNVLEKFVYSNVDLTSVVITALTNSTGFVTQPPSSIDGDAYAENKTLIAGSNYALKLSFNDAILSPSAYTITGTTLRFLVQSVTASVVNLVISYRYVTQGNPFANQIIDSFSIKPTHNYNTLTVKVGAETLIRGVDYTVSNNIVTLTNPVIHTYAESTRPNVTVSYDFTYDITASNSVYYTYDIEKTGLLTKTLAIGTDYTVSSQGVYFQNPDLLASTGTKNFVIKFNEIKTSVSSTITTLEETKDYYLDESTGFLLLNGALVGQKISIAYEYAPITTAFLTTPLTNGKDYEIEPKKGVRFLTDQCLNTNIDIDYTYTSTTTQSVTRTIKTNNITLNRKITRDYPVLNTVVANCMSFGALQARVTTPFDVESWGGVFEDTLSGSPATAQFNYSNFPITVLNRDAIEERWAIIFVTEDLVDVVGEHTGMIAHNAPISEIIAPLNPATNFPYFSINPAGWGGGWSAGNALRFNTKSAAMPFWIMQSIKQGESTSNDFNFSVELRAEVDTVA